MEVDEKYLKDHLSDIQPINARFYLYGQPLTLAESHYVTKQKIQALKAYEKSLISNVNVIVL